MTEAFGNVLGALIVSGFGVSLLLLGGSECKRYREARRQRRQYREAVEHVKRSEYIAESMVTGLRTSGEYSLDLPQGFVYASRMPGDLYKLRLGTKVQICVNQHEAAARFQDWYMRCVRGPAVTPEK